MLGDEIGATLPHHKIVMVLLRDPKQKLARRSDEPAVLATSAGERVKWVVGGRQGSRLNVPEADGPVVTARYN